MRVSFRSLPSLVTGCSLVLAATVSAQAPALSVAARPFRPGPGALVIVGGGGSTPAIWDRFMELAGGDSAVIVYVPTASAGDIDTTDSAALRTWRGRRPKSAVIMHTRSRDVANTDAFVAPLRRATGVWFGGGVQSRITDAYLGTRTEEALHDVLRRGGVIGGTSAGAAIMTEVMITGGNPEATLGTGFAFLPSAVADQHFTQRNRQPRLVGVLAKHPGLVGFGVDEATALIVHGSRHLEVLGRGRVNVITTLPGAPVDSMLLREAPAVAAAAARDSATRASGRRASPPRVLQGDLTELTRKAQERARRAAELAITGVTVVDVESGRTLLNHTVIIAGTRIIRVGPDARASIPAGARVVRAAGKFLIPGLWDTHVHLSFAGANALPLFVAHGVTSVRDLGSRIEEITGFRQRIAAGEIIGPTIRTSGPLLEGAPWMKAAYEILPPDDPFWSSASRVIVSRENVRSVVDSLQASGVDLIKSRNVWGEDFLALAAAAERAGIPLASHNPNRVNMVDAARSGLDSFEHAESIWGDFDTLSVAARARMFRDVAKTGALVTATLMADIGLVVSSDSVLLSAIADTLGVKDPRNRSLPRPMRAVWAEAVAQRQRYGAHPAGTFEKITRDVRAMSQAGIPMLAGTDVGGIPIVYPGSSLHEELELLVREGGLTALAALQSATRNPPRFFGSRHQPGIIAPGGIADLVLLDANPLADIRHTRKIAGVVLNGRYLDRAALDALIAGVEVTVSAVGTPPWW